MTLILPEAATVEQFILESGAYPVKVPRRGAGHIRSSVVSGFELSIPDLFAPDGRAK